MAEFGIQATELSAPQGAGTAPVGPATANWLDNGVADALGNMANIFQKGLEKDAKSKAEALKQGVIGGYVREQARINDAIASGAIKPTEAQARSRALFSKYAAGYSEYIEDFDKAGKALRGFSELGDVEDAVKSSAQLQKERISAAQGAGFYIPDDPQGRETVLAAYEAAKRADTDFQRFTARAAEARAGTTFDNAVVDRQRREMSVKLLTDIADSNMDASFAVGQDIANKVRNGTLTAEAGQLQWQQSMTRINAQLQAAAALNPELAAPYRSLFNELNLSVAKLMDPATELKTAEDEVKLIIARSKLVALADPTIRSATAVSQLLGGSAEVALSASSAVTQAIVRNSSGQTTMGSTDPVIGKPEVEKDYFKVLTTGMDKLNGKSYADEPTARKEITNNINETLRQVGDAISKGADAKTLKNAADFFASPQFGKYATENQLEPAALQAAKQTFQLNYESTVVKQIDQALQTTFKTRAPSVFRSDKTSPEQGIDMSKLAINFNGSGVSFSVQGTPTSAAEANAMRGVEQELKAAQAGVNKLIHIGAHMQGTTDYAKFWEDNKHVILPRMFSKYEGLEIGTIKNGYRFTGGDARDAKNWEPTSGGQ